MKTQSCKTKLTSGGLWRHLLGWLTICGLSEDRDDIPGIELDVPIQRVMNLRTARWLLTSNALALKLQNVCIRGSMTSEGSEGKIGFEGFLTMVSL